MNTYFARGGAPNGGNYASQSPRAARSAALLIDFDNVTLGVHTDLGRELKNLINSEIFRGKIAVRRAYADWRRYPNYVVPLTEASIDLIFAPAYGSSKKNTTDLRMSADAIELAFTRPEIDTFILLTGDSDFSSTVMKLKEYGKYVIGVGMRESSSDLIIQNCDEYFSYHTLSGLTRAGAGEGMREDPWELAARAAQKMVSAGDAMRSDRLKQVMLSIDPGFNEKELGYSKFSRFVSEAEKKGLLKLHKLPDGQYEITIDGGRVAEAAAGAAAAEPREPYERREARGGRRDRRGDRERPREPQRVPAEVSMEPAAAEPAEVVAAETAVPPMIETPIPAEAEAVAAPEAARAHPAMALLQRAVRALAPKPGAAVRDGDVKRKMLEFDSSFDESSLGYSKFSRFLRFAHEQEAIDLERLDGGQYEVKLGGRSFEAPPLQQPAAPRAPAATGYPSRAAAPTPGEAAPPLERPAAASLRGRHRHRGAQEPAGPPPLLPGQVIGVAGATRPAPAPEAPAAPRAPARKPADELRAAEEAPAATAEATAPAAEEAPRRRGRRGRRGEVADAAPELLPGQVVAAPVEAAEEAEPKRRRGGRARKRPAEPAAGQVPAETFSAEALQLPMELPAIETYITGAYKGVGKKTVEPLLEAFGTGIFQVFAEEPERVAEVIGARRAGTVLDQWHADYTTRTAGAPEPEAPAPAAEAEAPAGTAEAEVETATRTRRRGGRGRKRQPETGAAGEQPVASAPPAETQAGSADRAEQPQKETAARPRRRGGRGRKPKAEPVAAAEQPAEAPRAEAAPAARKGDEPELEGGARPRRRGGRGRKRSAESNATGEQPAEAPSQAEAAPAAEAAAPAAKPRRPRGRGRGGRAKKDQPTPA